MVNVKLGDICIFIRNGANIKNDASKKGIPITRIETIANGNIDEMRMGYADIFDNKYEDYYLKKNDILMSHINSMKHLGKVAICDEDKKVIHGMNLLDIRFKSEFNAKYLYYFFKSNNFKKQLNKISKQSVNQSSFSVNDLKKIQISIPEESQQAGISVRLDKVQEIIDIRKTQIEELDELIKSCFSKMFGERWMNSMNWNTQLLGECTAFYNGKAHEHVVDKGGKYILVTSKCIASDLKEYRRTNALLFPLKEGDICMVMSDVPNGRALAKCMIIDKNETYTLNQRICCFRDYKLNPVFLLYLLNRHEYLLSFNDGDSQTNLRKEDLLKCPVIVPPKELQNQFADFVRQIDKQKFEIQKSLEETQKLQDSLMNKYFGG